MNTFPTSVRRRLQASCLGIIAFACATLSFAQIDKAEFDQILADLSSSDLVALNQAKIALHNHVSAATAPGHTAQRKSVEAQLLAALGDPSQPQPTKLWLLRQLEAIGGDAAVPDLAELLAGDDDRIADSARMALQSIPTKSAADALLAGLKNSSSSARQLGLLQSIGARKHAPALEAVAALLESDDDVAAAAVDTIALIGSKKAVALLESIAKDETSGQADRAQIALVSLLRNYSKLASIADQASNPSVRAAAFAACAKLSPSKASKLLASRLSSKSATGNAELAAIAIRSGNATLSKVALAALPTASPAEQLAILAAFPNKPDSGYEALTLPLAESENEQLRLEAVGTLGRVGSYSSLATLLKSLESRDRDLRETAAAALARIQDSRIDDALKTAALAGQDDASRVVAIQAIGHRNGPGAAALLNRIADDANNSVELRREAVDAMENAGDASSFKTLVKLVVEGGQSRLRRDALVGIKRMSRRAADPDSAWVAVESGLAQSADDPETRLALISILDAAASPGAIAFVRDTWATGDENTRSTIMRTLASWRNWDAGTFLVDLLKDPSTGPELRKTCFETIGRLILGSDATFSMSGKFALAESALALAKDDSERKAVLNGFRYSKWQEGNFVRENPTSEDLKQAVIDASSR